MGETVDKVAEQGQNAMLERLCRKHGLGSRQPDPSDSWSWDWEPDERAMAFGRELLRAVQERDAAIAAHFSVDELTPEEWPPYGLAKACDRADNLMSEKAGAYIREAIVEQTYADLFMEEK